MSFDQSSVSRLRDCLDRNAAISLLQRAVGTPSVTGTEAAFAHLLANELTAMGAEQVRLRNFCNDRPNVTAHISGSSGRHRILLTGHTDTVHVRGWSERWSGSERESPFSGAIVDGALWGRGSGDLKAGICAVLSAAKLLAAAGIRAPADLAFAFIGDEESGEPGSGVSAGMKALVEDITLGVFPRPDFAIYVEPTQLNIYTAQMGFLICDITVTGKSSYFGVPEAGVDAVKASHAILAALFAHSKELEARAAHPLVGHPFVLVTGISGGGYIAVPGECSINLILKLLPGESVDAAVEGLERAVRSAKVHEAIGIEFSYPAGRDHRYGGTPSETSPHLAAVKLLAECVSGVRPDRGAILGAPYWSEAPFLVDQLGVPTVYCAPGDIRNCHTLEEHVDVEEYLDGIIAIAAFLACFGADEQT